MTNSKFKSPPSLMAYAGWPETAFPKQQGGFMRRSLFLLLTVIVIKSVAWCKNIVVGSIQYLGTNTQGVSAFKVVLNANGITESPITLDNMSLAEQRSKQSTGSITTPVEVLFLGGSNLRMPACPCRTVRVDLLLKGTESTSTFRLRTLGLSLPAAAGARGSTSGSTPSFSILGTAVPGTRQTI